MNKKITLGLISLAIMSCGLYAPRGGGGHAGGYGGGGFHGGGHAGGGFHGGGFGPRLGFGGVLAADALAVGTAVAIDRAALQRYRSYLYGGIPYYYNNGLWYAGNGCLIADHALISSLELCRRPKWR